MLRSRARLAGVLAVPLLVAGCGSVPSPGSGLRADAAAADAALAGATGLGVVVRFEDPDGDLVRALQEGPGAMSAEAAAVVVGSRLDLRVAARDGRTLADQPDPGVPLAEQLRWADSALTVSTDRADLLSWRTVDGVLYVSSDLAEVERVAGMAGSPVSLADEVSGAPAPLPQLHEALRAGEAVSLPIVDLLEPLGALTGPDAGSALEDGLPDGLLDDLRAAVEPHTRITDLGSDDGVRRVTVEVDVKRVLDAVTAALGSSLPDSEVLRTDGVADGSVTGTLTIDGGHYRRLELPLAELAALAETADDDVPDLGSSALVVELDDAVEQIAVPARVADLDVLELLWDADGGAPTSPDDAVLACYEQAESEQELALCAETG